MIGKFGRDERGTVALMFGLSLVPLLGLSGAAVDYSRGARVRTQLEAALDAATLETAKSLGGQPQAVVTKSVKTIVTSRFDAAQLAGFEVRANAGTGVLQAQASGSLQTAFLSIIGIDTVPITAASTASWGTANLEIALVLDNTGSMKGTLGSQRKIDSLIAAAQGFVSQMQGIASAPGGSVKIGVVPFDTNINVGPSNLNAWWIDSTGRDAGAKTAGTGGASWQGCVWDRDPPNDASDTAPRAADPTTLYAPDPARVTGCGLAPVLPLTSNLSTVKTQIDQMKAEGSTNITIGLAWGLNVLSPSLFPEAAPLGRSGVQKIMIVMSDGWNTRNRWTADRAEIDPRTREACRAVKDSGIQLYTLATSDADTALLGSCATSSGTAFTISDAAQLGPVFQQIAGRISQLRISK